jgi:hypothetical protein
MRTPSNLRGLSFFSISPLLRYSIPWTLIVAFDTQHRLLALWIFTS